MNRNTKSNLAIALGILTPMFASGQTGSAARSFLQSPKFLQRFQQLNGVSYHDKVSEIVNVYLGFLVQNNFQIPERPNFSTVATGLTLLNLEGKSVSFDLTIDTNGLSCGSNVKRMIQAFANPTSGLLRVRLCDITSLFGKYNSFAPSISLYPFFKDAFEQQLWSVIAHELYHIIDPKLFNKKSMKDLEKHKAQTGDFRGRNFRSQLPTYAMMFVEDFWTAFDKVKTDYGKAFAENKLREFYHDPNKYYDWWKYYMPMATLMYDGSKPGEKGFYYSLQALRISMEDKGYV